MIRYLHYILLLLLPSMLQAQLPEKHQQMVDSLERVVTSAEHDTTAIKAIKLWDNIIYRYDRELDFKLLSRMVEIAEKNLNNPLTDAEKIVFESHAAYAYNSLGLTAKSKGDYDEALEYYKNALNIQESLENLQAIALIKNNMGNVHFNRGNHLKAIELYTQSLKIREQLEDQKAISQSYNNIGGIYHTRGDFEKAIEFYEKSMQIRKELNDEAGIAGLLSNIALIYLDKIKQNGMIESEIQLCKEYLTKALEINRKTGNKHAIAITYSNLGELYEVKKQYDKSIEYYEQSLRLKHESGDKKGIAHSLIQIADVYLHLGNIYKAEQHANRGLALAREISSPQLIQSAAKTSYQILKKKKRFDRSLEMYELYHTFRDSIISNENTKKIIEQEFQYQYEKQATADSIRNAEKQKIQEALLMAEKAEKKQYEEQAKRRKQQSYYLFGFLGLAVLFGLFIYNRFRLTARQNKIIEKQKEHVDKAYEQLEYKNKEITDSINYAKRIQDAILPSNRMLEEQLGNGFVLFKPKDVVSGDFYWMEKTMNSWQEAVGNNEMNMSISDQPLGESKENIIYLAAADCTGHGVPGAMVSVICANALTKSLLEENITDPGQILDRTRELIVDRFKKSGEDVKDGMDISLVSLTHSAKSKSGEQEALLQWSGANNPLWIVSRRKEIYSHCKLAIEANGVFLHEISPNKQPIGKTEKAKPFTTHRLQLEKGDKIYLFTDGYADQFGGDRGKKFKSSNFKKLILEIQNKDMNKEKELLEAKFNAWKGELEQLDDVCVIGIEV